MTAADDALATLAEAATPGPWKAWEVAGSDISTRVVIMSNHVGPAQEGDTVATVHHDRDKTPEFIAAANPQTVLDLLKRLRDAEAKLDAVRSYLLNVGIIGNVSSLNAILSTEGATE